MTEQNKIKNQTNRNWLGGPKNPFVRTLLVGLPTVAGGYLGWKHGKEFCDYVDVMAQNSDVFYHQLATSVPLLIKVTGAYLEGKLFKKAGQFVSGICEKSSESRSYNTDNTRLLNARFDPHRPYNYYATLGRAQYESFVESFILKARKTGTFKAEHLHTARKKLGDEDLEEMVKKDYLLKELRFGVPVVSPTCHALKRMYGAERDDEVVQGPFGYFAANRLNPESKESESTASLQEE